MSCAAVFSTNPPAEMQEKMAQYGHAIMTDWVPQQALLEHPVRLVMSSPCRTYGTHYLLPGHGVVHLTWRPQQYSRDNHGRNSHVCFDGCDAHAVTLTVLTLRILWPISADQPVNTIHLTDTLNVAYELIEVRHGSGLGKIYRNGRTPIGTIDAVKAEVRDVLDRAFGEDGAKKRENLLELRKTLQAAWTEEGVARREVEAFLDDI